MKKIRIIQVIGIVLFIIYFGLFVLDLVWELLSDWDAMIFSVILALISLSLIYKGVLLKSSSTLWFSINLILSAIFLIIINLLYLDLNEYYYIFSLIPIISSLFNLFIFKYKIYIKVIILNISVIIPIIALQFFDLEWWIIVVISVVAIALGVLICRSINFEREKVK